LKKVRVKIPAENLQMRQKIYIKEVVDVYIKRMIKDLSEKVFKYYTYIEYYDVALDFIRSLKSEKVLNITFSKEPRISREYLI